MNEHDLEEKIKIFFKKFNDLKLTSPVLGNKRPDFVLEYGDNPVAIIEIKPKKITEDVKSQMITYINQYKKENCFSIIYYIANVNNEYWYYDNDKEHFEHGEIFILLNIMLKAIYEHADNGDSLINDFKAKEKDLKNSEKYWEILTRYLEPGNLLTFGNRVFFKPEMEINFMKELLKPEDCTKAELCKYTSAKSFYYTSKNGRFWLNDIAAMNDALETKAIEKYPNLRHEASSVGSHIYNGYIMCFSRNSTDKLMNWNMYGDSGKGVCYTIKKDIRYANDFYFAPVVYVKKTGTHKILSFLNDLSGLIIKDRIEFHLRLWHIWKYFFKYDYYESEKEERLLYMTTQKGEEDWSEKYETSHHVEIEKERMPFKIKKVILGPRCANSKKLKEVLNVINNQEYNIRKSSIKGYRG